MTGWWWGPMIGLDTETTAPDPEQARLVQVGIVTILGPGEVSRDSILVNPGVEIPEGATAVHGITTRQAWADGVAPTEALEAVADVIGEADRQGWPVIIFNAPYDLTVIDREWRRQYDRESFALPRLIVDPFVIDRALDKYRKGKRTLEAMCEHHRIPQLGVDHAHDATTDAFMACRLAWRLAESYPEELADLDALQEKQVAWYRERQEDFIRYLQREGKPIDDVSTLWPIRPKLEAVRD